MKKIQNEKNDLTDEVVLLQHRLSIQIRKLEECQHELRDLRSYQIDKSKDSTDDLQSMKSQYDEEITRLTSEKEKLKVEISDYKNINEELQHQHETSLEMYIMKVQELEEVMFVSRRPCCHISCLIFLFDLCDTILVSPGCPSAESILMSKSLDVLIDSSDLGMNEFCFLISV